jgi:hypothetical protein
MPLINSGDVSIEHTGLSGMFPFTEGENDELLIGVLNNQKRSELLCWTIFLLEQSLIFIRTLKKLLYFSHLLIL